LRIQRQHLDSPSCRDATRRSIRSRGRGDDLLADRDHALALDREQVVENTHLRGLYLRMMRSSRVDRLASGLIARYWRGVISASQNVQAYGQPRLVNHGHAGVHHQAHVLGMS
jgi:hypothetical protein